MLAEVLRTADKALSTAYIAKTGMSEEDALEMMEAETWLTAQQAKKEKGLIDAIMFEESEREILADRTRFSITVTRSNGKKQEKQ